MHKRNNPNTAAAATATATLTSSSCCQDAAPCHVSCMPDLKSAFLPFPSVCVRVLKHAMRHASLLLLLTCLAACCSCPLLYGRAALLLVSSKNNSQYLALKQVDAAMGSSQIGQVQCLLLFVPLQIPLN
jgi:hypothetical protein